jgi:hypothetical protein
MVEELKTCTGRTIDNESECPFDLQKTIKENGGIIAISACFF